MQNIIIDFAKKDDEQYLLKNSQLTSEYFNRKHMYDEILVAKIDNQSVGYLVYDYLWHHIPFISFIWVESKYRKNRIGITLLTYFENYLSTKNHNALFSSSEETAINAQTWHRRMGFKNYGSILEINDNNKSEVFFKKNLK